MLGTSYEAENDKSQAILTQIWPILSRLVKDAVARVAIGLARVGPRVHWTDPVDALMRDISPSISTGEHP